MSEQGSHIARVRPASRHARRERDPDRFGDGVDAVWGVQEDGGSRELQSVQFDASVFSAPEAKAWLGRHELDHTFEAAAATQQEKEEGGEQERENPSWGMWALGIGASAIFSTVLHSALQKSAN